MISFNNTYVMNFECAMRGARNPLSSWSRSDSFTDGNGNFVFGENDMSLAKKLCKAGSDHRKFIRQIMVSVDITAPLYWWKEFDTYKVGTVANSTSTMHKIHSKPIAVEDFSCDRMNDEALSEMQNVVSALEKLRLGFIETNNKTDWYSIIQLMPASYNQMRTCTLNYEVLMNIYTSRRNHKLDEWHVFCDWIKTLPYASELIISTVEEKA